MHGNGVKQLGITIIDAVPYVISVFFNPAANDLMMEAAIKDILDQLKRSTASCSGLERSQWLCLSSPARSTTRDRLLPWGVR